MIPSGYQAWRKGGVSGGGGITSGGHMKLTEKGFVIPDDEDYFEDIFIPPDKTWRPIGQQGRG